MDTQTPQVYQALAGKFERSQPFYRPNMVLPDDGISTRPSEQRTLISSKDTLSHQSTSPLLDVFGLTNRDGEFNCFLNVVLQALWHSDSFRQSLMQFKDVPFNRKFKEHRLISELQVSCTIMVNRLVSNSSRRLLIYLRSGGR